MDTPTDMPMMSPTPEAGITEQPDVPVATMVPTMTSAPLITMEPTPTIIPTALPLATPVLTEVPEPTVLIEPTPEIIPTSEPIEPPENIPVATETPVPSLTPTLVPTPTVNPAPLVANGWQKVVSIDEKYAIVFPEVFRDSGLSRTDRELLLEYTCAENEDILFCVSYVMKQRLMEAVEEILLANGDIEEQSEKDLRVMYRLQKDGRVYCGILQECRYSRELVGSSFGEEEQITGVMEVVFSYPAERAMEYETEKYRFYVVKNGEE